MQSIHSYSLILASYSVAIQNMINIMNIQDVQEVGLQKQEFAFSSKTVQNDDYCL